MQEAKNQAVPDMNTRLFTGERALVILGLLGLALAAIIALYIRFTGTTAVGPEGNLESAFSFNAALGLFVLSIAAIMPLAGHSRRKRTILRGFFIQAVVYAYAAETIQHFRGINPRFTRVGSLADNIFGALFGLDSLVLIVTTVLFAVPFFRKRPVDERPLIMLGIRYAFVSTMVAFAGGLWMIAVQGRMTGDAGNLIVLHGIGFHALQTLPLLGWLLERAQADGKIARSLIHRGSIAWMISIVLIAAQTALGRSVFEPTVLPIAAGIMLLLWFAAFVAAARKLLRSSAGAPIVHQLRKRGMVR